MSLLRADKLANQKNNGGPIIVGPSTISGSLIVTNNITSLSIGVTNNVSIGGSLTVDETLSVEKNASIIGSVGIGTTNPLAGLHIKGEGQTTSDISDSGSFDSFLRLSDDANNSGNGGGIIFSTQQGDVAGSAGFAAIKGLLTNSSNNTIGDLAFSTRLNTSDNTLSESLRILSNGSILSNLSSKYNVASFSRTHYISPFMGGSANQIVVGARNNGFPGIFFTKTTGTETNSNDAVSEGNVLGSLQAFGSNDVGFVRTNAKIDFKADEDFSGSPDNTPGRIEFWTCPPLSTSPEERIRITSGGYVGIGSTNPSSKFSVNGNAIISGILTAQSFYGDGSNLTGLGDTANVRTDTLVVTGVSTLGVVTGVTAIEATTYYGDGSNLTGLGDTANVSTNTLIVSGVSTLSGDVNIGQDLLITRDLQVTRNIHVDGNLTIGGTSATISAETLTITDPDIILGYRTDANGQDISTDDTASHGGVALASTEGSPLINLVGAGETLAPTYKKIMWFKTNSFTGLNTDAWLSNYAFGVGTTSMSSGTKFAVGNIEANFDDFTSVRNINSSGVITATSYVGDGSSLTNVLSDLVDDTTPQLGGDLDLNGNNVTGTSNIILTGSGRIGVGTDTPDTPLDVRTGSTLPAQFVTTTGSSNGAIIRLRKNDTNLSNNDKIGVIQFAGDNGTDSYISEISKIESVVTDATFGSEDGDLTFFTSTNGSSTEKVRINSSGNVGIATENPEHKLHVIGDARITGILTVGTSSLTLDGINDSIQVGSALTIGHSIGLQFHSQSIHSNGMNALDINATGVITATSFVGDGSGLTNVGGGDTSHIVADTFVVTGFSTFKGSGTEVLRITQDVNASVQQEFGIGFAANPNHTNSAALITFEEFDTSDSRGDLVFYTRGTNSDSSPTERLRIDSSGNIGIGTNNPIYGLDVRGTGTIARFGKPNSTDDGLQIDVTNSQYPKLYNPSSADTLSIVSTGSVQVSIDSNNNDTTKAFTVVSNGHSGSGTELFKINESGETTITASSTSALFIKDNSADSSGLKLYSDSAGLSHINAGYGNLVLETSGSERLRIDSSGNVGVGVTNPSEKLEVAGNLILDQSNSQIKLKSGGTGTTGAINFTFNTDSTNYAGLGLEYNTRASVGLRLFSGYPLTLESQTNSYIAFRRGTTETARIDSSGNLGIAINNPGAKLDVYGTARIGGTSDSSRRADFDTNGRLTLAYGDNNNVSNLILANLSSAATTNHGSNIAWNFGTNTSATPITAAAIDVLKSQQWTSTSTTQDSKFKIRLATDGSLVDRFEINGSTSVATFNSSEVVFGGTAVSATEGGQIRLTSASGQSNGDTIIDMNSANLRFFYAGSPNKGAYLTLSSLADGVGSRILTTSDEGSGNGLDADLWDGNQFATYLNQAVLTTSSPSFNQVTLTNNGNGTNVKIGDDAWIGDVNQPNTIRIKGVQNSANGYIIFGDSNTTALGRAGTGALTYGGNTVWHGGNDGSGSGLDADLLDGQNLQAGAATANTVAGRNGSGDIHCRLIRQTYGNQSTISGGLVFRVNNSTDNYLRVCNDMGAVRTFIGANNASNLTTGTIPDARIPDTITPATRVDTKEVRTSNGTELVLNAGESAGKFASQTAEIIYLNAENGVRVCTPSVANYGSGYVEQRTNITGGGIFFNRNTTAMGEITTQDTTWLRINQSTAKNIYTPRYIRADGGFFVDGTTYGINGTGVLLSNTGATIGGNTAWHAGNDGSGSGLDADTLDGAQPSVSAGNNTIVKRHSSGYIFANYFNTTPNDVSSGVTRICCETGNDGYIRHATQAGVRVFIGAGSGNGLDADTVDGFQAASFLRSDANDTATGTITFNGTVNIRTALDLADNDILRFGSGDDVEFFCNGSHMYMDLNSGIGNFYIRDGTTTRYTFNDNGSFTATGNITAYSDINLKENIEVIPDALNKVSQLRGVTFDRIDIEDEPRQSGVIAQEVEKVLPEVVGTTEDGTKTVAYGNMVGLLIEAIKEQQKQIDDLKAKLEENN